jgi:hypothetical protein
VPLRGVPDVDYDDLRVHRNWREYEPDRPDEVRYFMYQMSQRDLGDSQWRGYWKAVRFLRVTRVPRYLRQIQTSASGTVFDHQRKLLAGLREQQVLFLNVVANMPGSPLIFAYGVQAVGTSPEVAQAEADRAYAVLETLLDGVYQQLEYQPLSVTDGENLVRYQNEWRAIGYARGRPRPLGGDGGVDSWLDGNRTDVENTANMLETFIRGMSDRPFLMSMVTVPLSPFEINGAWKNVADRLSEVRSDQSGTRSVTAGIALPMTTTVGDSHTDGTSHQTGHTLGQGTADSLGHTSTYTEAHGVSAGESLSRGVTVGESASVSHTEGQNAGFSQTTGLSEAISQGISAGESMSHSQGTSLSEGIGTTSGVSHGVNVGHSLTEGTSLSHSQSNQVAENWGSTSSLSQGVSSSQSLSESVSSGANWSSSLADQITAGMSRMEGLSQNHSTAVAQAMSTQDALSDSIRDNFSSQWGANLGLNGGLAGGGLNASEGVGWGRDAGHTSTFGSTLTGTGTQGVGMSSQIGDSLSRGVTTSESLGGSYNQGVSAANSVGQSMTSGQSLTQGASVSQGQAVGQSMSTAIGQSYGQSVGASESLSHSAGLGRNEGLSQGVNTGQNLSASAGSSAANTASIGQSTANTVSQGQSQSMTDTIGSNTGRSFTQSASAAESLASSVMANRASSDAYVSAVSRSMQNSQALGAVPSFGMMWSRNTFDESRRMVGDMLQAQMNRYMEGIEGGAFYYQLSLACPDSNALGAAAGLLKAAFWGSGVDQGRLPQPFHVATDFAADEAARMWAHHAAFTLYRKRERRMELIEPYQWSTFLVPSEGAAMTHPPTAEAAGLLTQHDSMPVFAMPAGREDRDLYLGHLINGERGKVTTQRFGIDLDEITHMLLSGTTGSGKTTFLQRLLAELARQRREIVDVTPTGVRRADTVAGALVIDWGAARSYRGLANIVGADRFRLWDLADRRVGGFRWNLLALPVDDMDPLDWAGTISDLFMVSYGLRDYGRSLFFECVSDLYSANRLEEYVLRPAVLDGDGRELRAPIVLPRLDESQIGDGIVAVDANGVRIANVRTHPQLSRLVGIEHVAVMIASKIELAATPEGKALGGADQINRLQSVWRRLMPFAPGHPLHQIIAVDRDLSDNTGVRVTDLVDPDTGLFTVLEVDGLDLMNRRLILGGIIQALYRWGTHQRAGFFDHQGKGPGTWLVLEEAHELFGAHSNGEDSEAANTRVTMYETLFRRSRQLGMRIIAAVQNPSEVPNAITGNCSTIVTSRVYTAEDKAAICALFNWMTQIGQQIRESRYLGEMAIGHFLIRMDSKDHFLDAAPVHVAVDPPALPEIGDDVARQLAGKR